MPLAIPPAVHNYNLQLRETDWVLYVQPTRYMQVLTEGLYFPQSAHFRVSIWCHAECDETSGGCSVNRIHLLPAQQACSCVLPARGMTPCDKAWVLPLPRTKSGFSGSTYKPTSSFDAFVNSTWACWLLPPSMGNYFCMGFREELIWWSAKNRYLFGWQIFLVTP